MASALIGFALLFLAAICGGLYTTPMGVIKTGWSFEATWFLYCLIGTWILPWTVALITIPDLLDIYGNVAGKTMFLTAFFGFLWGIGCQLFGIGISMVGNSLGFALILGLAATLGSVIPLVCLHPDKVASKAGTWNFIGLSLAVVALVATAIAGIRKERDAQDDSQRLITETGESEGGAGRKESEQNSDNKGSFGKGIVICVLSGVFSACLNLATSFGEDIGSAAADNGAADSMKNNAIFGISIACGGIPNLAFCGYTMWRKGECPFSHSGASWVKSLLSTTLMGVLWFGSNVAYGVATTEIGGDLGTVVGWPIYIIGMVLVANVSGVVTGEWKSAGTTAKTWMGVGLFILCLAIVAVGLAG